MCFDTITDLPSLIIDNGLCYLLFGFPYSLLWRCAIDLSWSLLLLLMMYAVNLLRHYSKNMKTATKPKPKPKVKAKAKEVKKVVVSGDMEVEIDAPPQHNNHQGWKPRVTQSTILVCTGCTTKYIKTRPRQVVCIRCTFVEASAKKVLAIRRR